MKIGHLFSTAYLNRPNPTLGFQTLPQIPRALLPSGSALAAAPDPNAFLKRILFAALEREGVVCARKMPGHGALPSTIDTGHA